MLRKRIFMQQNRKRPREEQDNEGIKPYKNIDTQLNAPLVHLDNHNETLGFNDGQELQPHDLVPKHLQLELNDEAIAFDKKQDLRAQSVMLQMKSSFEEVQCNDPMMVAEYTVEIFERLKMAENDYRPDANYIDKIQREITWSTRGVLIDWVIEIHYLFSLLPETLFLAINIIDRFLSVRRVALAKLQLVGAAALFVATKFEEMYCPSLEDFLSTTDGQIDEDEFVRAECLVLQVLDFHICYANPLNFLRRLLAIDGDDQRSTRILSKYLMEVCAIDHRTMAIKPSLAAAASVCLARRMLGRTKWPAELEKLSGYTIHDLKPVVEDTLDYLSQPVVHDAFFKKWFSKRLSRVSIFARDWVNSYYIA
ncbi:hypothetical protein G6F56_011028 [Rhizopus delemar]|nr:hypothetical protein G6F56_011028 [Rhizopus delemar]